MTSQNKVFHNAKWIIACKIVQSLAQMLIGMISARYLGPSNYGLISYASSVTAFALPVMQLGMRSTLVQEYIVHPDHEGEILGTALAINLMSGVASMMAVACFVAVANAGETTTIIVCIIYSVTLLAQALEMIQCWFQAKYLSKYSSLAMLAAYIGVSAYKIYLLVTGKNVYWFAMSHAVEYGMSGILFLLIYHKYNTQKLSVSWLRAKDMVQRSKYYILSALMVTVFQSTDHVMLKLISGDAENGYYTTAMTCSLITGFLYSAIADSARPAILEARAKSYGAFEHGVSSLYSLFLYLTVVQSLCFSVFAKLIVMILYGDAYMPAVPVLRIVVWQTAFSYMGVIRNIWILAEGKYDVLWKINLCGMLANIILNALLIPSWGACGAALASVLTQFITNFVVGFFMKPIRRNNYLLLRGFNPKYLIELVKEFRK